MSHFPGPDCPCDTCRKYQWREKPETESTIEHISRDIREGRFPQKRAALAQYAALKEK